MLKQQIKVDKLDFFQKCIIAFEKFFLFWVPMNILKDWKAKLESSYSFMLKYSKITVSTNGTDAFKSSEKNSSTLQ